MLILTFLAGALTFSLTSCQNSKVITLGGVRVRIAAPPVSKATTVAPTTPMPEQDDDLTTEMTDDGDAETRRTFTTPTVSEQDFLMQCYSRQMTSRRGAVGLTRPPASHITCKIRNLTSQTEPGFGMLWTTPTSVLRDKLDRSAELLDSFA